jgi:putative aldouronate transport system substrate-binding protein
MKAFFLMAALVAAGLFPGALAADDVLVRGTLLGTPPPGIGDVVAALNAKLHRDLGVRLELDYVGWNEVNSKYPLVLAAGDGVDWIYTASWAPYTTQAVRGAFKELTPELLKKWMPRHWAATPAVAWDQAKVGGRVFMVPTNTPDKKVPVALIRGDLRRKYGLAPVTNVRDLEPYLAAVKKNEPNLVPINLGNGYDIGQPFFALLSNDVPPIGAPFFGTIYGNYEDPNHGLVNLLDEPYRTAYKRAAVVVKRWHDQGYFNKAPFANVVLSKQSFAEGRSAVGFGNSQDIQDALFQAVARGFDPEIVPILSSTGHSNADSYTGNGVAVAMGTRNVEKSLQVLDLLMEDPSYARLVTYGVEGLHWVKTPDGKVAAAPGFRPGENPYPLEAGGFWFVDKNLLLPLASWSPAYLAHRSRLDALLVPNTFLDFSFVPTKVKNEFAAITTVMAQYGDVIAVGAVANVDRAVAALEAQLRTARQDQVLAELKAQLAVRYPAK